MPHASVRTAAALASGNAIASLVPAAAANAKITMIILGIGNSGGAITDFQAEVGVNRGTARGTSSATASIQKNDPNEAATVIIVDSGWTIQPTIGAVTTDDMLIPLNTRGTVILNLLPTQLVSTVGTANPIVFVNRSQAALPASHYIDITIYWTEIGQ